MHFIKKNLWAVLFIMMFSVLPAFSFAQPTVVEVTPTVPITPIDNPLGETKTVEAVMKQLLVGVIKIGIPIVALAIIYSGFLFVKAQGNPEELTKAKEALLYSLIGAAILLGAWAITEVVFETVKSLAS